MPCPPTAPRFLRHPGAARTSAAALLAAAALVGLAGVLPGRAGVAASPVATEPPDDLARAAWRQGPASGPRAGHDALLDAARDRLIVHGGEAALFTPAGETAALDLADGTWSPLGASGSAPAARLDGRGILGGSMVLDAAEDVALAQCDCTEGSAFLDLAAHRWSAAPNDSDVPYVDVLASFVPGADRAVFFGGAFRGLDEPSPTAFAYDLSTARAGWSALPDVPFLLQYQAFDRDASGGHLVAFGGQDVVGDATAELWRLDLSLADQEGAWVQLTPGVEDAWPAARIGATLTFMGDDPQALLLGGYDPATGTTMGDLWLLDLGDPDRPVWTELALDGAPPARSGHAAAWDPERRDLVVHGGVTVAGSVPTYYGDTWLLDVAPDVAPTATTPSPTATTPTPDGEARIYLPLTANAYRAPSR